MQERPLEELFLERMELPLGGQPFDCRYLRSAKVRRLMKETIFD